MFVNLKWVIIILEIVNNSLLSGTSKQQKAHENYGSLISYSHRHLIILYAETYTENLEESVGEKFV